MGVNFSKRVPKPNELATLNQLSSYLRPPEEPEIEEYLRRIWVALIPADLSLFERKSEWWKTVGFQSEDPISDVRGGGVLSLIQLTYFAENFNRDALEILESQSERTEDTYPFAAVSINATFEFANFFSLLPPRGFPEVKGRYWSLAGEFLAMHDVYALFFILLHQIWTDLNVGYLRFGEVMLAAKKAFGEMLSHGPADAETLSRWSDISLEKSHPMPLAQKQRVSVRLQISHDKSQGLGSDSTLPPHRSMIRSNVGRVSVRVSAWLNKQDLVEMKRESASYQPITPQVPFPKMAPPPLPDHSPPHFRHHHHNNNLSSVKEGEEQVSLQEEEEIINSILQTQGDLTETLKRTWVHSEEFIIHQDPGSRAGIDFRNHLDLVGKEVEEGERKEERSPPLHIHNQQKFTNTKTPPPKIPPRRNDKVETNILNVSPIRQRPPLPPNLSHRSTSSSSLLPSLSSIKKTPLIPTAPPPAKSIRITQGRKVGRRRSDFDSYREGKMEKQDIKEGRKKRESQLIPIAPLPSHILPPAQSSPKYPQITKDTQNLQEETWSNSSGEDEEDPNPPPLPPRTRKKSMPDNIIIKDI